MSCRRDYSHSRGKCPLYNSRDRDSFLTHVSAIAGFFLFFFFPLFVDRLWCYKMIACGCCIRLSSGYSHPALFTIPTIDAVRNAVSNAAIFPVAPEFSIWKKSFYEPGYEYDDFLEQYGRLYSQFILERRKDSETRYIE